MDWGGGGVGWGGTRTGVLTFCVCSTSLLENKVSVFYEDKDKAQEPMFWHTRHTDAHGLAHQTQRRPCFGTSNTHTPVSWHTRHTDAHVLAHQTHRRPCFWHTRHTDARVLAHQTHRRPCFGTPDTQTPMFLAHQTHIRPCFWHTRHTYAHVLAHQTHRRQCLVEGMHTVFFEPCRLARTKSK